MGSPIVHIRPSAKLDPALGLVIRNTDFLSMISDNSAVKSKKVIPAAFAWKGIPSSFHKTGFVVAGQRTPKKPIMRYYVKK
jgi:hypothetical protein